MQDLSKGYEKPESTDFGDTFFPAMARNIQRLNDHKHDGVTGEVNPAGSQEIDSSDWVEVSGTSNYSQTIALPEGYLYDDIVIQIRTSGGDYIYPTIERVSATSYNIVVNDNTLDLVAKYVS